MTDETRKPDILVVDDTAANLRLLTDTLGDLGYNMRSAPNGKLALMTAMHSPPDLILLDIHMPEMDGYEVCRRLKADPQLADIPVIFLSALSETIDKVKGFQLGAVDYVTKPFHLEEIEARIRTHVELRQARHDLQKSYDRLQELEQLRDNLVHMIAHDMRNPLSAITACAQMLENADLGEKHNRRTKMLHSATEELTEMISSFLDLRRLEEGEMPVEAEAFSLHEIVTEVCSNVITSHELVCEVDEVMSQCDKHLTERILKNLIQNAIKFTPRTGKIEVILKQRSNSAELRVRDNGPGIPPEHQQKIFEKFQQVRMREKRVKYSTGLGLAFCRLACEAQGGQIGVESEPGKGSTFWFTLPLASVQVPQG